VVEHSTHNRKIKGSNTDTDTGIEKMAKKTFGGHFFWRLVEVTLLLLKSQSVHEVISSEPVHEVMSKKSRLLKTY